MSYNNGKTTADLWAVLNKEGHVMWSRGGSSSSPKLLVYESEKKAQAVLRNMWIRQIILEDDVTVEQIYTSKAK